jgi:rubrerythrin
MGRVKQEMMDNEYNQDLVDFLKTKLDQDELSGAIQGITKQLVDQGIESLKGNQKSAIESFVEKYSQKFECEVCSNGNVSTLSDYLHIEENSICPMCEYDREKYMKD